MARQRNIWLLRLRHWWKNRKGFSTQTKCDICWSDKSSKWHGTDSDYRKAHPKWKWVCDDCYQRPPSSIVPFAYVRKLERSLPKNHILGPEVNGVRGVYEVVPKRDIKKWRRH